MKIMVWGGDKETKDLVKEVAEFCANKLFSKKLNHRITIRIYLDRKMENAGEVWSNDEDKFRPRNFQMNLNKAKKIKELLRTICHEMVHVKQFAKNELVFLDKPYNKVKFKNEYFDCDEYWDCPWEIEAYGREPGLYTRWVDETGRTKNRRFDTR